jgi:hypothetical protein
MPHELATLYDEVWQNVMTAQLRWRMLDQITQDDETVDLLNSCAPNFFAVVQETLTDAILLDISRFCDPEVQGRKRNLTIKTLSKAACGIAADINASLDVLTTELDGIAADIKLVRNKRIAHSDLSTCLDTSLLPSVKRNNVRRALDIIVEIMQLIDARFGVVPHEYYDMIAYGDGRTLVELLRKV